VTPTALKGQFLPKYLQNGETHIGNVTVRSFEQKHPGRSFAYRLIHRNHSVVYATDSELDLLLDNPDVALEHPDAIRILPRHVEDFVRHTDLLIADTQYTDAEYPQKIGWGHSRLNTVVDLAIAASVRKLALFHHDPHRTDEQLDELVEIAQKRADERNSKLVIFAAAEGQSLVA
jgi:phosphoribosyl 1,2-cyclic phosphodiesterase